MSDGARSFGFSMRILGIRIDSEPDPEDYAALLARVSPAKRERIGKFLRRADGLRCLLGDALARLLIAEHSGLRNESIGFECNPYGKPMLAGAFGLEHNVSHSGDRVVCAVDGAPVGIDVEEIGRLDIGIARHFFSAEEYADLASLPEPERRPYLYGLWALKESYIKATGKGFSEGLDSFTIKIRPAGIVYRGKPGNPGFLLDDSIAGYRMAVCSLAGAPQGRPEWIGLREFTRRFRAFAEG
jgi:4'-phosphopantetheinyl transferase